MMDGTEDVIKWAETMGYDGEMPETLNNICNKSRRFIWDQLMENAKPRQQVEEMRKNIVINRLKQKPLDKQDEHSYPVDVISTYVKKQALQRKLKNLETLFAEKQRKVNQMAQNNKMKYIVKEKLVAKVKEDEEREYLLRRKCGMLDSRIREMEETLTAVTSLTPVEFEGTPSTKEITEILQQCAAKLEKLIRDVPLPDPNAAQQRSQVFFTARKPERSTSFLEKYVSMTARKSARKTTNAMKRSGCFSENKENEVKRPLFLDPKSLKKPERPKRDSLGILPESCFDNSGVFSTGEDAFLQAFCRTPEKRWDGRALPKNSVTPELPKPSFDKIYANEEVAETLNDLLHTHNRQIIWNVSQTLIDNLHVRITKNVLDQDRTSSSNKMNEDDICKLQLAHVQMEIQAMKNNLSAKGVNRQIAGKKEEIRVALSNHGLRPSEIEHSMRILEIEIENVELDASLAAMKKEIGSPGDSEEHVDLQIVLNKLSQVKENIGRKVNSIQQYIDVYQKTLRAINRTRERALCSVYKMKPFSGDLEWLTPLTEGRALKEIEVLRRFPLEYNRRCSFTNPDVCHRNLYAKNFPTDVELDADALYILSEILESPFGLPETALLDVLKAKSRLNALSVLQSGPDIVECEKYSLEDLERQESYLDFALDRLSSLNRSSVNTQLTINQVKTMVDIWVKMPFMDYVCPERRLDGHDYKFYERKYDSYYNNL